MYKKIRLQLTIVCAVSTGLVLIAMAFAAMVLTTGQIREQYEKTFQTDINSVFYYLNSQNSIDQTWLNKTEANNGLLIGLSVRDKELVYTGHDPLRKELTDLARLDAREQFGFDYLRKPSTTTQPDMVSFSLSTPYGEYRAAVATVMYGDDWLGVTILKDTAPEKNLVFRVQMLTVLCISVALVFLIIFSRIFIGYTLKPVEESRRRQSEFVSAASHELRSPLSVISASAGAIKKGTLEDAVGYADKIESECVRLSRLTADLLKLAGADAGTWSVELSEVDPETLVIGMAERFEELAAKKNISLDIRMQETTFPVLRCDGQRIEQALTVLIDNALGYTPEGGSVRIGTYVKRKYVYFTVTDSGTGVPDEYKEKVFDRFFRGESSRSDKEHFGIGLAVAREIAALHKGRLYVRDAEGGGAEFVLALPY